MSTLSALPRHPAALHGTATSPDHDDGHLAPREQGL